MSGVQIPPPLPEGMKNMVTVVRVVESSMGSGEKEFLEEEKINADKLREHLKI